MNVGARHAKVSVMNDDGLTILNCFPALDLVEMEPVRRFPEQGPLTRAEVLCTMSDYLWAGWR